jgi:hypothetical protein
VTASEEHVPERRQDQRRQVAQPAFYGENRVAARRTDDAAEVEAAQAAQPELSELSELPELPGAIPRQDYEFLTGLISMEHSG